VGLAEQPGERPVEAEVEGTVAELVEHRVRPVRVVLDVREHPHVALAVDVDAERVLRLPVPGEEVAASQDRAGLEPDPVEGLARELDDVRPGERLARVDAAGDRHLLEEDVLVVPRAELLDCAVEPARELRVDLGLPARERRRGQRVALVERREQPLLVHLARRQREREPVAVAEATGRLVAQPGELAHVVRDRGADRLRPLPRLAPLRDVVALAKDPPDLVVVELPPAHGRAVLREARLDRRLELDDPVADPFGHLLRRKRVVEEVELAAREAVRAVLARLRDRAEQLRVGERVR
jgi:hypothetical protein